VLMTEETLVRWNYSNKKWYESKGYIFTKWKDEFLVRVQDLSKGSHSLVDVICDNCGKILSNMSWGEYKRGVRNEGENYCYECAMGLYGRKNSNATKLNKGKTFKRWCYDNLTLAYANEILSRWDYERNKLGPDEVGYSSGGVMRQGYWFKCLKKPEHGSELKKINNLTGSSGQKHIDCNKCNMAQKLAITHPYLVKLLANKEDALKYSVGSKEKICFKCPICGNEKHMAISTAIIGFGCPKCSDHIPYSEKFIFNLLEQLGVSFKTQLSKLTLNWCGKYRYDFYIPSINCVVETHGLQHYQEIKGWRMRLNEIKINDHLKEQTAKKSGVKNYIILDCRKSEVEWIKESVARSPLLDLLKIEGVGIDWSKCHEHACSSLVRTVCDYWNKGFSNVTKLAAELSLDRVTVTKYLKQGVILGWCNYDPEKEIKKNYALIKENKSLKVVCVNTGEIFNGYATF